MDEKKIVEILNKGEGIDIEFKESKNKLNRKVFNTVCSFLNRNGGHLLLGVRNDGKILGIEEDSIESIKNNFVSSMNNRDKLNPTFYLSIQEIKIQGKTILYVFVPESSQVHRANGEIYDRNEDGDFKITDNISLVSALYLRKQSTYSENKIFPAVTVEELRDDIFIKIRKMASNQRASHPWQELNNLELLKSAGLYIVDPQTGEEGITLAGILIFGNDQLISAALPHFKTDAILRVENTDRYDDRDDIRTNLIDSYERLMQFIAKHLSDKFYLENDQRINVRDKVFREVVSNILIHREYSSPYPAKLIIEKDKVVTENSNKAHGQGMINPENFSPYPKNPKIAQLFKEIGWVEELGSGIRNTIKYNKIYSGGGAEFIESDIFKTIVYRGTEDSDKIVDTEVNQIDLETKKLLRFCEIPRSRNEIEIYMGIKSRSYLRVKILNPLIKGGLLELTIPDKPTSPNQKYISKKI